MAADQMPDDVAALFAAQRAKRHGVRKRGAELAHGVVDRHESVQIYDAAGEPYGTARYLVVEVPEDVDVAMGTRVVIYEDAPS